MLWFVIFVKFVCEFFLVVVQSKSFVLNGLENHRLDDFLDAGVFGVGGAFAFFVFLLGPG